MQDFRNIEAWRLSMLLAIAVYKVTRDFPEDEQFGLTSQVRRSCNSIGANIAEAFGRGTRRDVARVLRIAKGEGNETFHHLTLAVEVGYLSREKYDSLIDQLETVRQKLHNLCDTVKPPRRRRTAEERRAARLRARAAQSRSRDQQSPRMRPNGSVDERGSEGAAPGT